MLSDLVPETVVDEGRYWTIAVNLNQNLIGRLILVLNRNAEAVTAVSSPEWSDLHREIARTRHLLNAMFQPDQYNYAFLMNQAAQVHLHVVPRYAEQRTWSGAQFEDIHYGELFGREQRILPTDQLARLAVEMRRRLPSTGSGDSGDRPSDLLAHHIPGQGFGAGQGIRGDDGRM